MSRFQERAAGRPSRLMWRHRRRTTGPASGARWWRWRDPSRYPSRCTWGAAVGIGPWSAAERGVSYLLIFVHLFIKWRRECLRSKALLEFYYCILWDAILNSVLKLFPCLSPCSLLARPAALRVPARRDRAPLIEGDGEWRGKREGGGGDWGRGGGRIKFE